METHHEVYQDDHEWLDLLVDDDQNKLHFQVGFKLFWGVNGKNFETNHSLLLHKYQPIEYSFVLVRLMSVKPWSDLYTIPRNFFS